MRAAIGRIEGITPSIDVPRAASRVALGGEEDAGERVAGEGLAIDHVLGGGLPRGALHEVVAARPGDAGAACGFALALAARFTAACGMPVVWIVEDGAWRESGAPYLPGLAAHGLDPARLLLVRTAGGAETLWAMEEALKCPGLAAVIADLWRTKPYDLVASRRLVLAAQRSATPGILVPAGGAGTATALASAARTRFEIATMQGCRITMPGGRMPLPGSAAWGVRLARIRAGPDGRAGNFDWEKIWPLVWDHEEARFRDALPLGSPALLRDRPHSSAARRRRAG